MHTLYIEKYESEVISREQENRQLLDQHEPLLPSITPRVNRHMYQDIFNTRFNLSFKHPRSDTCAKCDLLDQQLESGLLSEEEQQAKTTEKNNHIVAADAAYDAFRADCHRCKISWEKEKQRREQEQESHDGQPVEVPRQESPIAELPQDTEMVMQVVESEDEMHSSVIEVITTPQPSVLCTPSKTKRNRKKRKSLLKSPHISPRLTRYQHVQQLHRSRRRKWTLQLFLDQTCVEYIPENVLICQMNSSICTFSRCFLCSAY